MIAARTNRRIAALAGAYRNKNVVLSGAASGIARDLAEVLAPVGARLALIDLDSAGLEQTRQLCLDADAGPGGPSRRASADDDARVLTFVADVTDAERLSEIADDVLARWGHVDLVFASAGVAGYNDAADFSPEADRTIVGINYFGAINTLAPFISSMKHRGEGQLVGLSSLAAVRGLPRGSSYSASKAALRNALESWRIDLAPHGVSVTCISPGFVDTPMSLSGDTMRGFFALTVRQSTLYILEALTRRPSHALYPWRLVAMTRLGAILPDAVYERLVTALASLRDDD